MPTEASITKIIGPHSISLQYIILLQDEVSVLSDT